jgi:hypothetical protein
VDHLVERERRLAVVAEGFLDDDARPSGLASQAMLADRLDDRLVGRRRRREVEEPVRVRAESEVELVERPPELFVSGVVRRRDEVEMLREAAPDLFVQRFRPAVLRDRRVELLAILLVGQQRPRRPYDGERRGEQPLEREVVERGDELALREISRTAEDDDRRGLGDA